jgi:DNA-binding MarR family transcriptional regulator
MWSRPGFLLRRLHQIHYGLFFDECGSAITPLQFGMLTVLTEFSKGADISALANQLGIDRSNTADVARRLVRRGYATQATDRNDRRRLLTRITKEGRRLLRQMEVPMQQSQEQLLAPLSTTQKTALITIMTLLVLTYNDKGRAKMQI